MWLQRLIDIHVWFHQHPNNYWQLKSTLEYDLLYNTSPKIPFHSHFVASAVICRIIQIVHFKEITNWDMEKCHEKWQHKQIKKLRIWKEITELSEKKSEPTHASSELTSLLHCCNRASHVKHATEQKTIPQKAANKVWWTKTRQSALSKRIWAALLCLLWDRFFNSSLLDTNVIHQRWQMWHDSSAWEAAVTTDRELFMGEVCQDKTKYLNLLFFLCPECPKKKICELNHL